MRFNDSQNIKLIPMIYFYILVSIGLFIFLSLELKQIYKNQYLFLYFIIPLLSLFLYIYKTGKYFEYDSDGETLSLTNKGILVFERYNYRENKAEFPKYKLKNFEVSNYYFFKCLSIKLRSKNSQKL